MMRRLWPKSLSGQLMLALALALLVAQLVNAAFIYNAQRGQAESQLVTSAAVRLIGASERLDRREARGVTAMDERIAPRARRRSATGPRSRWTLEGTSPAITQNKQSERIETKLRELLGANGVEYRDVAIAVTDEPYQPRRGMERRISIAEETERGSVVAALQRSDGQWLSVRFRGPQKRHGTTGFLIGQTVLLYLMLLLPMIFIIRRAVRPLHNLTQSVRQFRVTQQATELPPAGPRDVSDLTKAFNDMSARISSMISEKDVMLGAIGHDLKTPLAALRVRLESVDDDDQRAKMVAGVEDINRTLDDILSLARIGHPAEAPEQVNLTALVETIAEEFADLGKPVEFAADARIVLPLHLTWMRRAVRNLVSNAVRYGGRADISLHQDTDTVTIRIDDGGPGINEADIERMFEPFARLESSRNQATGGSGLGLTLARAIAQQNGGKLHLANRYGGSGDITGLRAELILPNHGATL